MYFTTTTLTALILLSSCSFTAPEETPPPVPPCATPCSYQAAAAANCVVTDLECGCRSPTFLSTVRNCQTVNCTVDEQTEILKITSATCAKYGGLEELPVSVTNASFPISNVTLNSTTPTTNTATDAAATTSTSPSTSLIVEPFTGGSGGKMRGMSTSLWMVVAGWGGVLVTGVVTGVYVLG